MKVKYVYEKIVFVNVIPFSPSVILYAIIYYIIFIYADFYLIYMRITFLYCGFL